MYTYLRLGIVVSEVRRPKPPEDPDAFKRWIEVEKIWLEHEKAEIERAKLSIAKSPLTRYGPLIVPIVAALLAATAALLVSIQNSVSKVSAQVSRISIASTQFEELGKQTTELRSSVEALAGQIGRSSQRDTTQTFAFQSQLEALRGTVSQLQLETLDRGSGARNRNAVDTSTTPEQTLQVLTGSRDARSSTEWSVVPDQGHALLQINHLSRDTLVIEGQEDHQLQSVEMFVEHGPGKWELVGSCPIDGAKAECDVGPFQSGNLQVRIGTTNNQPLEVHLAGSV